MGKFDRKVSKNEPVAPSSIKILKKKSNASLAELARNPKGERERNMKILGLMQRADEIKSSSRADAHFDSDKMVSKQLRKEQKSRKRDNWS